MSQLIMFFSFVHALRACRVSLLPVSIAVLAVPQLGFSQQSVAPEQVVGRQACQSCHPSEAAAWEHSSHHKKAWDLLDHPKAAGFAKALGITNVKGASLCTQCHGTQQKTGGTLTIAEGNSCESCHGGAGGADGWLFKHFDFGSGRRPASDSKIDEFLADRAKETPEHRAARDAAVKATGMNRSADAFEIASNCLQCHLVPNEKLFAAGHPLSSRFEFVEWAQGEVRHNFLLNAKTNAEIPSNWSDRNPAGTPEGRKRLMFVAGQLADLEVSLRSRAEVTETKRGSLGDEANDRILDLQKALAEHGIDELKPVLAAIASIDKKSLKDVTPGDRATYTKAAAAVSAAAAHFVTVHQDGSKLPASMKTPSKAKGDVYQP
ncbi:MAG TPA: multiheme c-type cytochrome [Pirellulaceae bacterium]|nr:multiheme c-type cytochrome [Pirellulaceae bacterium]